MPGTNAGTGPPLVFRCSKCKILRHDQRAGLRWEATGLVRGKPIQKETIGRVSRETKAQYRCLDCGHVGWSGHRTVLDAALDKAKQK